MRFSPIKALWFYAMLVPALVLGPSAASPATIALAHPKDRKDSPIVEIYFEKPDQGRPGKAYAFRGTMVTRDGGPDYVRFRKDFEAVWEERFPAPPAKPRCKDE